MWSPPSGSSSASDPADLLAGVIRASVERGTGSPLPSSQRDALLSGCRSYLARATSSSDMSPHAAASEAMRAWAWRDRVWGRMGGFSFSDANISAERIISSAVSSWRKAMAAPPPTSDEADPFPPIRQTAEAKAAAPSLANPTMTMGDIPF